MVTRLPVGGPSAALSLRPRHAAGHRPGEPPVGPDARGVGPRCPSGQLERVRIATDRRRSAGRPLAAAAVDAPPTARSSPGAKHVREADVIVIGSGIGGLCCAALLARYGVNVVVVESHYTPGGAAHTWMSGDYHFESGPSLYSGMSSRGKGANPLAHVFQAIDEELELLTYNAWNIFFPEGHWLAQVGAGEFAKIAEEVRGPQAVKEWQALEAYLKDFMSSAAMLPPAALRADLGAALTVGGRYLPDLIKGGASTQKLTVPFSEMIKGIITDEFLLNYIDLLSFLLSGLPADGTIAAEVAYMFNEWYRPNCCLEFPKGGSQAMTDGLVRGLEKFGGKLLLRSHVESVLVEGGRAVGVELRGGRVIKARKAVVSNASMWDTLSLLPAGSALEELKNKAEKTPLNPSFMHLHLGFDASGLDDVDLHHIIVNSWENGVDSEQNVALISIASVIDPDFAPPGKHSLHAYVPATEPWDLWKDIDRRSEEYKRLKEERSQVLWNAVERVVPDIRKRAEVVHVGTPLTHQRFLRRHKGTYGPGIKAGEGTFPGPSTPIPGLYCCGDSTFPGIGLPAVAASGTIAANTLVPIWDHWKMLDALGV
ncbi:unnamed protein product [Ostreobium quekettii]|uniref:Amine oxidase domain-containing protein n=1 Tax=Ostreobium quekettii TaxID=121088 RepID=A0A8S1J3Q2_9CHLO|nr:unnamed protein product [Ostreobium quekettii]|eukprot:evm.model.scf_128EXC.5 EVM.evm.TU.scf_128EXC.5   scf_128EXC:33361-40243(-)